MLVEVDDFLIACRTEEIQKWIQEKLCGRFKFGKWERDEADYIGRRIQKVRTTDGPEIRFSQEKYVVEKIHPIELSRGRRGKKEDPLTEEEFKSFRSMLYRISWVAHQTRPEVSGTVSILASKMHRATVQEAVLLNKAVGHLRSTSKQALRIRGFESSSMTFIGVSDAGGVDGEVGGNGPDGMVEDPVQGAWMVLTSSSLPTHDRRIPVSVISWRSSKLKRRVTSTMASETLALSQCLGEVEWLQVMFRDLMYKDVDTQDYHKSITPFLAVLPEKCKLNIRQTQCTVTDAKSLYDAIYRQCPASRQDRRNALELAVVIDVIQKSGSQVRWTPHQRMPVDMLTKADVGTSNGALLHLVRSGSLRIDKEDDEMLRRQREKVARSRSRHATQKLLEDEAEEEEFQRLLSFALWST